MAKCGVCNKAEAMDQYGVCLACWQAQRAEAFKGCVGLPEVEGRKRSFVPQAHASRHRPKRGQPEVETPLGEQLDGGAETGEEA